MELTRKIELSLYWYIRDFLPSTVSVEPSYKEEELQLPVVSIDASRFYTQPLELGNVLGLRKLLVNIDIFADTKQQRDDIADILYNLFKANIPIYDFEITSVPPLPPFLGYLRITNKSNEPMVVFRDLVEKFYWHRRIILDTDYLETEEVS